MRCQICGAETATAAVCEACRNYGTQVTSVPLAGTAPERMSSPAEGAAAPVAAWLGVGCVAFMLLGVMLPWVRVGALSLTGLNSRFDGPAVIALSVCGLLLCVLAIVRREMSRATGLAMALCGGLCAGFAVFRMTSVSRLINEAQASGVISVGAGLWLIAIGAGVLAALGVVAILRK